MRILQLNTRHCRAAQDLLGQTVVEKKVDIAMLSEPFQMMNSHSWIADTEEQAVIWAVNDKVPQSRMSTPCKGFTWMKLDDILFVSCYAPPRLSIEDFTSMMAALELEFRGKRPILIAGDFNAWSRGWGSTYTNARGKIVEETFAAMDLVLLNTPGVYTFDCTRGRSIIDLAFADRITANRIKWKLDESIYTQSDHLAIVMDVCPVMPRTASKTIKKRWKQKDFNAVAFGQVWADTYIFSKPAEEMTEEIAVRLERACDATMPRSRYRGNRKPAYWWTDEIAKLRKDSNSARRKAQRARGRTNYDELHKKAKIVALRSCESKPTMILGD